MSVDDDNTPTPPKPLSQTTRPLPTILYRRWRRLNEKDEHWMCGVVGEEGSGKSYTALYMAKLLDPTFDASRVFFDPSELLDVLREEKYERGNVYVIDEAGVGLGNRTWHDKEQVATNQALQLIRDHNIGVVFTLPRLSELDSQAKGRLQDVVEMLDKEPGEYATANWWTLDIDRLDISSGRDGAWLQKPTFQGREVASLEIPPAEFEFITEYEEQKEEFQKEVYADAIGDDEEQDGDDDQTGEELILNLLQQAERDGIEDLLGWHGGRNKPVIKTQKIQYKWDISRPKAQALKDALRDAPGISVEDAWERRDDTDNTQP